MQKISEMSAAFLSSQSGEDTQFAYFQSYLVVKFIYDNYGLEPMKATLRALADGTEMNAALAQHVAPLADLDKQFLEDAKSQAAKLGGSYTFESSESIMEKAIAVITPENNYFDEMGALKPVIEAEDWETARVELEAIIEKSGYLPGESEDGGARFGCVLSGDVLSAGAGGECDEPDGG